MVLGSATADAAVRDELLQQVQPILIGASEHAKEVSALPAVLAYACDRALLPTQPTRLEYLHKGGGCHEYRNMLRFHVGALAVTKIVSVLRAFAPFFVCMHQSPQYRDP